MATLSGRLAEVACASMRTVTVLVLAMWALAAEPARAAESQGDQVFAEAVRALNARSFELKREAATHLAQLGHPRGIVVLERMLAGQLYAKRQGGELVFAEKEGRGFVLTNLMTGEPAGEVKRRGVKKVSVNNSLRRTLRGLIAGLRLYTADPEARIAAINDIVAAGDSAMRKVLAARMETEQHADVLRALADAIIVFELDSDDDTVRLAAIRASDRNLSAQVRQKLTVIAGDESEPDALRVAAREALTAIERLVSRYELVETLFFGLSLGSILVLAAIGLSITFGVMGVINMAHGELIMIGAYTTYVVQLLLPDAIEYSLLVAVPAAFVVAGLTGIAIERTIIRFLYGRPLETLLATFGVSLVLQQAVRSIFSPLNRSVATPEWMSGSLTVVEGLSVTYNRLYIFVFAILVFMALVMVLRGTRLGLEVRAVTQNREMAHAMGINCTTVDVLTFGLGAGIAGVAGVALSQLTNVGPNLGQGYIVDSFMVVVFGGVGNLWGTLVAGLSLGLVNKVLEPMAGAVVAKILVLIFIILFIQKRPRGLFPQKGRAAEG